MTTISLEQAQAQLPSLIAGLKPGEILIIMDKDRPIARIVGEAEAPSKSRRPGSAQGKLSILCEDDSHLEDFQQYMP